MRAAATARRTRGRRRTARTRRRRPCARSRRTPSRRACATRPAGARSFPASISARRSCAAIGSSSAARTKPSASIARAARCCGACRRAARRASPRRYGIARLHSDGAARMSSTSRRASHRARRGCARARPAQPPARSSSSPGLPRLLIVTEGDHHLVAIDLLDRRSALAHLVLGQRQRALRLKRAWQAPLLTRGDSALTAIDVQSGAVVWRVRDRLRFSRHARRSRTTPSSRSRAARAAPRRSTRSTRSKERPLRLPPARPRSAAICTRAPAPRDRRRLAARRRPHGRRRGARSRGVRLAGFHRDDRRARLDLTLTVAPSGTSWLAVDDMILGNTPTGELVAIDASTGALRYRHVLGRMLEADVPRRLEPVLRGGALFVPHAESTSSARATEARSAPSARATRSRFAPRRRALRRLRRRGERPHGVLRRRHASRA